MPSVSIQKGRQINAIMRSKHTADGSPAKPEAPFVSAFYDRLFSKLTKRWVC